MVKNFPWLMLQKDEEVFTILFKTNRVLPMENCCLIYYIPWLMLQKDDEVFTILFKTNRVLPMENCCLIYYIEY